MVASLLKMADLDWAVPGYTTLCRRQKMLAVQVPYRRADGPLNLLIDSTGVKFLGDGEWRERAIGRDRGRICQWRSVTPPSDAFITQMLKADANDAFSYTLPFAG